MQWSDFYDGFWDWSDTTRKSRISSLEDMGPGEEVVEVCLEIEDEKVRAQLIRKAMKLGVGFTAEDFMNLDGMLSDELYRQLGEYSGNDYEDPYFDEDNMTWDDFYGSYSGWDEKILTRRVNKLTDFGASEEVCEAIQGMPTELEDLLYEKAVAAGVKFTSDEMDEMGRWEEDFGQVLASPVDEEPASAEEERPRRRRSFWGFLFTPSGETKSPGRKHDTGHCDGDCENCPPHYGYRYGRWYYGHGHQWGCQRGGNGGRSGKTYRD